MLTQTSPTLPSGEKSKREGKLVDAKRDKDAVVMKFGQLFNYNAELLFELRLCLLACS